MATPFSFKPSEPTEHGMKRHHLLMQIDHWEANDADLARETAKMLIGLLQKQFDLQPNAIGFKQ